MPRNLQFGEMPNVGDLLYDRDIVVQSTDRTNYTYTVQNMSSGESALHFSNNRTVEVPGGESRVLDCRTHTLHNLLPPPLRLSLASPESQRYALGDGLYHAYVLGTYGESRADWINDLPHTIGVLGGVQLVLVPSGAVVRVFQDSELVPLVLGWAESIPTPPIPETVGWIDLDWESLPLRTWINSRSSIPLYVQRLGSRIRQGESYQSRIEWMFPPGSTHTCIPYAPAEVDLEQPTPPVVQDPGSYGSSWRVLCWSRHYNRIVLRGDLRMPRTIPAIVVPTAAIPPVATAVRIWDPATVPQIGQCLDTAGHLEVVAMDAPIGTVVVTNRSPTRQRFILWGTAYHWLTTPNENTSLKFNYTDRRLARNSFQYIPPSRPMPTESSDTDRPIPDHMIYSYIGPLEPEVGQYISRAHPSLRIVAVNRSDCTMTVNNFSDERRSIQYTWLLHSALDLTWAGILVRDNYRYTDSTVYGTPYPSMQQQLQQLQPREERAMSTGPKTATKFSAETKSARKKMLALVETRSLKQAESLISCGLEFEFHRLNGKRRAELGVGELDSARLEAAVREQLTRNITESGVTGPAHLSRNASIWNSSGLRHIMQGLLETNTPITVLPQDLQDQIAAEYIQVEARQIALIRTALSQGPERTRYLRDSGIPNWSEISSYTELGTDPSVEGGEIRTVGPRTVSEFLQVSRILSAANFTVAENCSFHIHLSVNGVKHAWGARLQAEMYAYLLRNLHRMPEPVRKRIVHDRGAKHFAKLELSKEKFSAINFHAGQGTWEFRLFGNVHAYEDLRRCLVLAYESLRHAYSVKLGRTKSLLGQVSTEQIQSVLRKIASNPEKFWDTLSTDTQLSIEDSAA